LFQSPSSCVIYKHTSLNAVRVSSLLLGAGGPYNCFAGIDCSRALAKVSLDAADLNARCADLYAAERDVLNDWVAKFQDKYPYVGLLVDGTYDGK
jgi:membrane-associated progesterone receptor component